MTDTGAVGDMANLRLGEALDATARALVDQLDADACGISRVIGDVLITVAEHAPDGHVLQLGMGYLVADFPETRRVIDRREPRAVCVGDPDADPAEERVLRELGLNALLMLPLVLRGEPWGLVEVYREAARPFGAVEIRAATAILDRLA